MSVRRSACPTTTARTNRRITRPRLCLCVGAVMAALAAPASAASFSWMAGNYGVLIGPNPLDAPDTVTATTLADKNFNGINFVNNGSLVWATSARMGFLSSSFANQGLVDLQDDADLQFIGGSASTFTNSHVFRKSGGIGVSAIKTNIVFSNTGMIDAQVGIIDFTSGLATFHGGTQFVGAGINRISSNATFNDSFSASNLLLASGGFTGTNAVIHGVVQWHGGQFLGGWQLPVAHTLNAGAGVDKNFNGVAFANGGTINWQTAERVGFLSSSLTNNGLFDVQADANLIYVGGSSSTFTNSAGGTFRKSGSTGVTEVKANIHFVNSGEIEAQTGTIAFTGGLAVFHGGTSFSGAGLNRISSNAIFNDAFTSTNLLLQSGSYTGHGVNEASAAIGGVVQWNGGNFQGDWRLPAGQTLNAGVGGDKNFSGVAFVNDGTINWQSSQRVGFLSSGLTNNSLVDIQDDANLSYVGGSSSTITNNAGATLRKSAGAGSTVVGSNVHFVNHGTVDAQTGTIDFAGGLAVFHAGTTFTGAGSNRISGAGAEFNGAFSSSNLRLAAGTYVGGAAVLNGLVTWTGGSLAGGWTIAPEQTLVADSGSNKNLSGVNLDNQGTIRWQTDERLGFISSTALNQGLLDIQQDANLNYVGGSASTFVNAGVLRKSGGSGTTAIGSNVLFTNPGTIEALSGTIQLPNNFTNTGTIMGTAAVKTNTLTNAGTIAPGASPGMLTLTGDLVLAGSSNLDIELDGLASFDLLAVSGSALLDGVLTVRQFGSYVPQVGDSFTFLTYGSRLAQSEFDSIVALGWGSGVAFTVAYNLNNAQLTVAAVPEPGTYALWLAGLGLIGGTVKRRRAA